ncbi:unnamed protein product [Rotaria sp. Silwood2]|nr:unnamed protein product [Rotaria sp. Silwood2]CAF4529072.1 unnamed protein product [Rotaria sp. Silwood2]
MANTTELNDRQMEQKLKYQKLFDYTLSTSWYPRKPKWSSKQIPKPQRRIQYPFLIQWSPMNIVHYRSDDSAIEPNSKRRKLDN